MGILRFFLALSVLAVHAFSIQIPLPGILSGPMKMFLVDGRQAVGLFYLISGFYMAMVLNGKYVNSTLKFYLNRFLRLWPAYFVVLVITCLVTPIVGEISERTAGCSLWVKGYVWFCNTFIIGSDSFWFVSLDNCRFHYLPRFLNQDSNGCFLIINNPVFTVSIEMLFYIIAPFILKSLKRTWIFFISGIIYHFIVMLSGNANIIYLYHFFPSSFLYFGLGALMWHYFTSKKIVLEKKHSLLAVAICLILMFLPTLLPMIIILAFAVLIPYLFELTKNNNTDRLIGELSYPLYIVHYPVLIVLGGTTIPDNYKGLICFPISLLAAILLHFVVERPIDNWRHRLTSRSEFGAAH